MSFTSITFIFYFLPVFLLIYLLVPSTTAKNVCLLFASLVFYAWGEMSFTAVLLVSIALNYVAGYLISRTHGAARHIVLAAGITLNVGMLSAFKYTTFVFGTLAPALETANVFIRVGRIHLSLGISFFTFKAISYLVDLHRQHARFERNPISFATYLAMFPQLAAGPIMRFPDIQDALSSRSVGLSGFRLGVEMFIVGLGQKLLVANVLAAPVDAAFSLPATALSGGVAWLGALCYTLQVYVDFAGYTNMAIGLGHMLGFKFPANFNYPYIAESITDFWKRWHITLSTWFRDYLWFPLGASRKGMLRAYLNLLIVFGLCGLWHGAAWQFLAWGLLHGASLVAERAGLLRILLRVPRPLRTAYALVVVITGWVLFRADSMAHAGRYLSAMVRLPAGDGIHDVVQYLFPETVLAMAAGVVLSAPCIRALKVYIATWSPAISNVGAFPVATLRGASLLVILGLSVMALAATSHNPFIYFRF